MPESKPLTKRLAAILGSIGNRSIPMTKFVFLKGGYDGYTCFNYGFTNYRHIAEQSGTIVIETETETYYRVRSEE